ncbi:hypothetical protein BJ684DRAFT_9654 [Piptocephalis cylindrospora]|uniref:Cytochrome c oxidase assembly protein COX19 n=1 Tax=Piptocephalis cylindrospora TaxID=1907219 RepID=A0A4P9Y4E4_9FUNG|nr:hypothetical protein BJ684DRAFT_9654 [Piptocephalis cylindrospora]|eukprot:RKP13723.1 hypothetical protein BJ684DRAFT_9654 [Piptocephalis cylindrospora]
MSFGRPPNVNPFKATPPDRGSFPLDHEGLCKEMMQEYMKCLQANRSNNGACRHLSEAYLKCRMDRGLMDQDDMRNLGFRSDQLDPSDDPTKKDPGMMKGDKRNDEGGQEE